ncbi:MAG: sensor histidine kinase [Planctomycetota bacterium]
MARRRTPGRTLAFFSALGLAAVVAAMALLLFIQRRVIRAQRQREADLAIEHAQARCDPFKRMLMARLKAVVGKHPDAVSLRGLREHLQKELRAFQSLHDTGQGFHALVVDHALEPVASWDVGDVRRLCPCADHLRQAGPAVYTLPPAAQRQGEMPSLLCYAAPIRRDGRLLGGLIIHKELDPVGEMYGAVNRQMTWTVVVTQLVLLGALAAVAWSGHRAIAHAERCRAEDERLAAVGNLAAGIAHEIRNPLNTIGLTARYLERYCGQCCTEPERRAELNRSFEIIASEVGRLTRTLDDFLLLARPADIDMGLRDLDQIVDDALALFAQEMDSADVRLERQAAGGLTVAADADQLQQVFTNLVRNAIQAMDGGGTLSVTSERAGRRVRVSFADTGPGISEDVRHHIFEPYFSTKRSGLGLGLALSRKIVAAHDGTLEVANRPRGGAVFTVSVPAAQEAADG